MPEQPLFVEPRRMYSFSELSLFIVGALIVGPVISNLLAFNFFYKPTITQMSEKLEAATEGQLSNGNTASSTPAGYNFDGETKVITYAQPDPVKVNELDFPENKSETPIKPEDVKIVFPIKIANADFQNKFSNSVASVVAIETHVKGKTTEDMNAVQQAASQGNYIELFELMKVARAGNETGRDLVKSLRTRLNDFKASVNNSKELDPEFVKLSNSFLIKAEIMAVATLNLMDGNDKILVGSVPSQATLDALQATVNQLNQATADLAVSVNNIRIFIDSNQ